MKKEKIIELLSSQEADAVCTIAAYTIKKTPTEADNVAVKNIAQYSDAIEEKVATIGSRIDKVDNKDALKAAALLLQKVAQQAGNRWVKLAASILKKILS